MMNQRYRCDGKMGRSLEREEAARLPGLVRGTDQWTCAERMVGMSHVPDRSRRSYTLDKGVVRESKRSNKEICQQQKSCCCEKETCHAIGSCYRVLVRETERSRPYIIRARLPSDPAESSQHPSSSCAGIAFCC